jgi:hypothetical protein
MIVNKSVGESQRGTYNPVTLQDVRPTPKSPLFDGLESTSSRTVAGILFAIIFMLSNNLLEFSGLLMLVLLVCVLYRMDSRERQIAAIPLAFSTIRMALCLSTQFHWSLPSPSGTGSHNETFLAGLQWMPLLFAAYLFYSPWKNSQTSRIVFWYSMALLLSGLLPGDGYLYVSAMLFYTLFIAIGIALIIDFSPERSVAQSRPLPPPRPTPAAQPAFS